MAILFGNDTQLPWTDSQYFTGLTLPMNADPEFGGMALVTLTYDMVLNGSEGFSLSTLHELGHILGLVHPHDYWNTTSQTLGDSWLWGYTSSPMSYFITGWVWDFFDRQLCGRNQILSLVSLLSISAVSLTPYLEQYQEGIINQTHLLQTLIYLFDQFNKQSKAEQNIQTFLLLISGGILVILILIIRRRITR